ncbi:MAG: DUF4943 family protein [Bacteroidota bacterium]|nr:DUF4943 family protein [Bacteroidota bacterium]
MKPIMFFLIIMFVFFSGSCKKDSETKLFDKNLKVEEFIILLKAGTYTSDNLPDFLPEDIPGLLNHGNDFTIIPYFPTNDICSFSLFQYRLGECILWVIESIRLKYPYQSLYSRFPSCVPMLINNEFIDDAKKNPGTDPVKYRLKDTELKSAYDKYLEWWDKNNQNKFDEFKSTNPLDGLKIFWY